MPTLTTDGTELDVSYVNRVFYLEAELTIPAGESVRQSFGFDLEKGISRVTLDPRQEHYYLEVKRVAAPAPSP